MKKSIALLALLLLPGIAQAAPTTRFGPGIHLVGIDIQAGLYRSEGGVDYFAACLESVGTLARSSPTESPPKMAPPWWRSYRRMRRSNRPGMENGIWWMIRTLLRSASRLEMVPGSWVSIFCRGFIGRRMMWITMLVCPDSAGSWPISWPIMRSPQGESRYRSWIRMWGLRHRAGRSGPGWIRRVRPCGR